MDGKFLIGFLLVVSLLGASAKAETDAAESERLRKFDLALKTLGIPPEKEPDYRDFPVAGSVSTPDVLTLAKYIDPDGGLLRYLSVQPTRLDLYPAFFKAGGPNDPPEYGLATGATANQDSPELLARLERASRNVRANAAKPLTGLRLVVDPGHMGTPFWNDLDGKYVKVGGKTVAEGEIALWTAKLLATDLENLGAEVRLTRTDLNPVTRYTWENFDPRERLADYYYKSRDDWMAKYLALGDSELVRQLPKAPEVRRMGTFAGKVQLFLQEDMDARSKIVEAERPDVFVDIHFDSMRVDELQSRNDDVSVYVPGAVRKNETGARNQRADALKHLLDVRRWKQSSRMAKAMVGLVAKNLGLPLLKDGIETSVKVSDGVFARNIFQTKRATPGLCAFFEAFHYDYVKEFPRLTNLDREATYRGTAFRYPSRLEAVSNGIRDGLIQYLRDFQAD